MLNLAEKKILGGRAVIVTVTGPFNGETGSRIEDYLTDILQRGISVIIIDCSSVEYMSSGGIGSFLFVSKKVKARGGLMVIYDMPAEIRALFRVLDMDRLITAAPDKTSAVSLAEKFLETSRDPGIFMPDLYPEPLLVECEKCSSMIRIKSPGEYLCPECRTKICATTNMSIIFE